MKKTILISAYAISPYKGSEFGVAWNIVLNLSTKYNVIVLYGVSDEHMGETVSLKNYLQIYTIPGVKFIEVKPGKLALILNYFNRIGIHWMFYLAFRIWQKRAFLAAKKVFTEEQIDIIHQLVPIGFREPGYLWKINKPFIWGPIGGTAIIDSHLFANKSYSEQIKYRCKNVLTWIQFRFSKRVRLAFKKADVILSARSIDQANIEKVHGRMSIHFPEHGIVKFPIAIKKDHNKKINKLLLVWSGRIDNGKNLSLCLEALSKIQNCNWVLNVVGDGPLLKSEKIFAEKLNISSQINWHGYLPREQAVEIMRNSDLHIITSIAEGNSTVVFEAMSLGIPTLALRHSGMKDTICNQCGILIPIGPYDEMKKQIAIHVSRFIENPELLNLLHNGVKECLKKHDWSIRNKVIDSVYEQALRHFEQ
jgi:glycosyltransferase involved in cell wall biosynthesis